MARRPLDVDMSEILDAIEAHGDEPQSFLNLETGEIQALIGDDLGLEPAFGPDAAPWEAIPRSDAHEAHDDMQRFVETIAESDVQRVLRRALAGQAPFRRFRDELYRYPDLRARWDSFKQQASLKRALEWLEGLDIEPRYTLRQVAAPPPPPASRRPNIGIFDLLLLGAPDGKTELIDGRVRRVVVVKGPQQARKLFEKLARELMDLHGFGWHKSLVEGRSSCDVGAFHLSVAGNRIDLDVEVDPTVWEAFA